MKTHLILYIIYIHYIFSVGDPDSCEISLDPSTMLYVVKRMISSMNTNRNSYVPVLQNLYVFVSEGSI